MMEDTYSKVVRVGGGADKENRRGRRRPREMEKNMSSSSNESHGVSSKTIQSINVPLSVVHQWSV